VVTAAEAATVLEPRETARRAYAGYADEERPFAEYALLAAVFNGTFAALVAARRSDLPERYSLTDLVLTGVATHKLSRVLAKDRVTSFLRAPFTRFREPEGHGEVSEEPRGTGLRRALGELLICPYCIGLWVSGGLSLGLVHAPRVTRLASLTLSSLALSDALQLAYRAAEDASRSR
jgi:hypothetical protein